METKRCARTWRASLTRTRRPSVYTLYDLSCRGRWECVWEGGGGEGGALVGRMV